MAYAAAQEAFAMKGTLDKIKMAKINTEREKMGLPPIVPWTEELKTKINAFCRKRVVEKICPWMAPDRCKISNTKVCTAGTFQNDVINSVYGFVGGLLLSFLWFLMMFYQLEHSALLSTIVSIPLGSLLSLGMAFSSGARCMVLLSLPNLFSGKGRSLLITYAVVLTLKHPLQNFRNNVDVMSQSATCGQEMAYNTTREIVDTAMSPINAILDQLRQLIVVMVQFADRLRRAFVKLKDLIKEVMASISKAFGWLKGMVGKCNDKMGGPYKKCKAAFDNGEADCRRKLSIFKFLCNIVNWVGKLCNIARIGELFCHIARAINNFIKQKINVKLAEAVDDLYNMFYFNVTLEYHYNVTMIQSKTFKQVKEDMKNDIENRLKVFKIIGNISYLGLFFMMTMLIVKATLYRHKYLTKDRFDNYYITHLVEAVDERRRQLDKETILPLKWKEQWRYIKETSIKWTSGERKKIIKGLIPFSIAFIHAMFYIVCDYGLYWLMRMIEYHGKVDFTENAPTEVKMKVQGEGLLADIYRTVINQFDPQSKSQMSLDTSMCLPHGNAPNYYMYKVILTLFFLSFLLLMLQAYGLRLRHKVAAIYYPNREKMRAVWLYNHILARRGSFLKHLRRQLRKDHDVKKAKEELSLAMRLATRSKVFAKFLKLVGYEMTLCLGCGTPGQPTDKEFDKLFVKCDNHGCKAVYCLECFDDINNMCTVCMNPVDYGDLSDFSEERDSSDSDMEKIPEEALDYTYQYRLTFTSLSSSSEEDVLERPFQPASKRKVRQLASLDDIGGKSDTSSSDSDG